MEKVSNQSIAAEWTQKMDLLLASADETRDKPAAARRAEMDAAIREHELLLVPKQSMIALMERIKELGG